jgi:hypothetical protein
MPKYRVKTVEERTYSAAYEVTADSREDAFERVMSGDADETYSELVCIRDTQLEPNGVTEVPDA